MSFGTCSEERHATPAASKLHAYRLLNSCCHVSELNSRTMMIVKEKQPRNFAPEANLITTKMSTQCYLARFHHYTRNLNWSVLIEIGAGSHELYTYDCSASFDA